MKERFLWRAKWFLIGLVISISVLWPFLAAPYFTHHDDVQMIRIYEMHKCFLDFQIPCRWVPDLGNLYGYPLFNYYAPLPYYIGGLIYTLTNNLTFSAKAIFIIPFVGAYIFMYLLARRLWGDKAGCLAGVVYSFAPYHSSVMYVRGAMGELWALFFFPAIFWSLNRLIKQQTLFNGLLFTFSTGLLLISHNLSTMIFVPLIIAYAVLQSKFVHQKKRFIIFFIFGLLLAVMLASFYLLPMVWEKPLVHVDTTTFGYFSYTEHFKGFKKLLLDFSWGWGDSVREVPGGRKDGMSFQIGIVHVMILTLSSWLSYYLFKKDRQKSVNLLFFILTVLFAVFMVNPRSYLIWKAIEPLKYLQFPWRFLSVIIFSISVISGSLLSLPFSKKTINVIFVLTLISLVSLNFSYFRPKEFRFFNDKQLLSGDLWSSQVSRAIYDYLPIYAKEPPAKLANAPLSLLTGDAEIMEYKQGSNWINFKTNIKSHTIIRLSQYYFPDWRIKVDGQEIKINYENSLGLMTFILGKGMHTVEARLYDTPVRIIGNALTIFGAIISLFIFLVQFPATRKRLLYYIQSLNR